MVGYHAAESPAAGPLATSRIKKNYRMKNYLCCNIKDYERGLTLLSDPQTAHLPMQPHVLTEKIGKRAVSLSTMAWLI